MPDEADTFEVDHDVFDAGVSALTRAISGKAAEIVGPEDLRGAVLAMHLAACAFGDILRAIANQTEDPGGYFHELIGEMMKVAHDRSCPNNHGTAHVH